MPDLLLDQALAMPNMCRAWEEVDENKGIPGVDGISLTVWRRGWEERLQQIILAVRMNTYKPRPLRQRRIPKKTPGEFRTLQVPTVSDRVLQRAVLQVLHPVFERHFMDCSYGYRPRRGLAGALRRILVLRENGFVWVLDADIDDFFGQMDHNLLLDFLKHDLPDESLMPLIKRWLRHGCLNRSVPVGISLGSPLSPLWANVFLHRLDRSLAEAGWPSVRYADDFLVFSETCAEGEAILPVVGRMLEALKLRYEPSKTNVTSFEKGFEFLGVRFEGDVYSYIHQHQRVQVKGNTVDPFFKKDGPEYE